MKKLNPFAWTRLINKAKKHKSRFDWHFKAVNPSDYEVNLTIPADSKILDMAMSQMIRQTKMDKGLTNEKLPCGEHKIWNKGHFAGIYNVLDVYAQNQLRRIVQADIGKDGVYMLSEEVVEPIIFKIEENGDPGVIKLKIRGQYVLKNNQKN